MLLIVGNLVKDKQDLEDKVLYLQNMNSTLSRMIPPKVSSFEGLSSEQREMSVPASSSNDSSTGLGLCVSTRKLDWDERVDIKRNGRKTPRSSRRKLTVNVEIDYVNVSKSTSAFIWIL